MNNYPPLSIYPSPHPPSTLYTGKTWNSHEKETKTSIRILHEKKPARYSFEFYRISCDFHTIIMWNLFFHDFLALNDIHYVITCIAWSPHKFHMISMVLKVQFITENLMLKKIISFPCVWYIVWKGWWWYI